MFATKLDDLETDRLFPPKPDVHPATVEADRDQYHLTYATSSTSSNLTINDYAHDCKSVIQQKPLNVREWFLLDQNGSVVVTDFKCA